MPCNTCASESHPCIKHSHWPEVVIVGSNVSISYSGQPVNWQQISLYFPHASVSAWLSGSMFWETQRIVELTCNMLLSIHVFCFNYIRVFGNWPNSNGCLKAWRYLQVHGPGRFISNCTQCSLRFARRCLRWATLLTSSCTSEVEVQPHVGKRRVAPQRYPPRSFYTWSSE